MAVVPTRKRPSSDPRPYLQICRNLAYILNQMLGKKAIHSSRLCAVSVKPGQADESLMGLRGLRGAVERLPKVSQAFTRK
ncbi:hypothetical protein NDU88_005063 [Pleurodeles waltl]|uniref:Uncharacterized protein n=1 Tax=Pleurodeles waltl TaxID=8319 RepID=A0AAV7VKV5_PLEWA|nr:hypothetical protein NDU88_005063 [Pleurodeles waltl]